jgi:hypothetical protein
MANFTFLPHYISMPAQRGGEGNYSSESFETPRLERGRRSARCPGRFIPIFSRLLILQEARYALRPVCEGTDSLTLPGCELRTFQSLSSVYWLWGFGWLIITVIKIIIISSINFIDLWKVGFAFTPLIYPKGIAFRYTKIESPPFDCLSRIL